MLPLWLVGIDKYIEWETTVHPRYCWPVVKGSFPPKARFTNQKLFSESIFKLKSCSSINFSQLSITSFFFTEHGSNTAVICAKFQSDWTTAIDKIGEHGFARFDFKTDIGRIWDIDTGGLLGSDSTLPFQVS